MGNSESVNSKAVHSVKWSVLIEVITRTIQPIFFLVLARLLTPDDFGLASAATIVISFSQIFWDAGLGKALIQTKEEVASAANVVFWANAILGVIIYAILFTGAPLIAAFFQSPGFVPVLRVVGLQVIIQSLSSVQQALLMRDMGFRKLFSVKLVTALVPGLFSIPMALAGFGVWALVAGTLASSISYTGLLWSRSNWHPKLGFDQILAKKLFRFGFWVVGESFVGWFMNWGDNLVVGHFFGTKMLGVYAVAWNICNLIYGLLLNPIMPVLYSTFSRLQDDRKALVATFERANRIVIAIALPVGVGLLLLAPQAVEIFFGEKWQGLGLVLRLIGFMFGVAWIVGINPEVYRSVGRPDLQTKLMFFQLLYYLPAFIIAAQFNIEVFSYTRLAVAVIATPIHVFLAVHFLHFSPIYLWKEGKSSIFAVLLMAGSVILTQWIFTLFTAQTAPILKLIVEISLGGFVYFFILWCLDRKFISQTLKLAKQAVL